MAIFSGKQNQQEQVTSKFEVTVRAPGIGKVKLGVYAENRTDAVNYVLSEFPDGKVTHIKQK